MENSTKKQVLERLTEIYEKFKDIDDPLERLKNYANYLSENFEYDRNFYEDEQQKISSGQASTWTTDAIQSRLSKLLVEGKGTCQQFSQALAILSQIDYDNTSKNLSDEEKANFPFCHCVQCKIKKDGKNVSHQLNCICKDDKPSTCFDVSSAIQSRGNPQNTNNAFTSGCSFDDYKQQMVDCGKPLAMRYDGSTMLILASYKIPEIKSASQYYDYITSSTDIIEANYNNSLITIRDKSIIPAQIANME